MSLFSKNPWPNVPKSTFKVNYNRKLSFKGGALVPIVCKEVLPGDKFKINANSFIRQMPLVTPTMHQYDINFAWFFVPNRLVWDEFKDFITGGTDGTMSPQKPFFQFGEFAINNASTNMSLFNRVSTLPDYLGFPVTQTKISQTGSNTRSIAPSNLKVDAIPFRAYQLIYNYYFRDQNLQPEVVISKGSGQETNYNNLLLRNVCWKKDYFTSALPFAQRGPEVEFNIGSDAPLVMDNTKAQRLINVGDTNYDSDDYAKLFPADVQGTGSGSAPLYAGDSVVGKDNATALNVDVTKNTTVDLSSATATTINEFRRLYRLQQWFETKALGGGRYKEQILSFFGVESEDARLDYPEYLGGGSQPFVVDAVAQTSNAVDELTPLSTLAGKGLSVGNFGIKTRQFKEHGLLFCLAFARPKPAYQQGLPKLFTRFDSTDYYWPTFARLGEQEVKNQELYLDPDDLERNDATFGYQSRYADYKFTPDTVHGQFKTTLNYWHMGRIFKGDTEEFETSTAPTLSSAFVQCYPTKRVYAITDKEEDELLMEVQFNEVATRKMPYRITPSL